MPDISLVPVTAENFADLVELIHQLAEYEHLDPPDEAAQCRLLADLTGERPRIEAFLAVDTNPDSTSSNSRTSSTSSTSRTSRTSCNSRTSRNSHTSSTSLGYAIILETYSSFLALPTMYLEDIFVREDARKHGVGSLLFDHVVQLARSRGCGRVDWQVLDWNRLARDFYERRGALCMKEWMLYRIDLVSGR
ncbi:MAG: GNAT family N-acetyltransferase [Candidatus Kapabacteria bacterium]|nr:GNAT family N-acetyltransferase [Candidatus Kapabacteria bacterium]